MATSHSFGLSLLILKQEYCDTMIRFGQFFHHLHTSARQKAAITIERTYKKFTIAWHDKTHQGQEGDKLMEDFLDNNEEYMDKQKLVKILAR